MVKLIKMDKIVVIGILFLIFLVVCCTCRMREGYVSNTITGPNDNTLVINDDDEAVAVITDDDNIYINEDAVNDLDDADINSYYGPYGNNVTVAKGPHGNTAASTTINNSTGLHNPSNYLLKSQVVPPVCPVCPSLIAASDNNNDSDDEDNSNSNSSDSNSSDSNSSDSKTSDSKKGKDGTCTNESCYQGNTYKREVNVKCPPCPACARCPEPAFDCKKIPTYKKSDDRYLPKPILSDFSTFGM
jgi:hypothetical protein